jgi:extracellular elastinolytic metalloproteinase
LRQDPRSDTATGVTHVFFRQIINGIEVADGNINVTVKDGAVISYGDSVSIFVVLGAWNGAYFTITPVLPWQCAQHLPH